MKMTNTEKALLLVTLPVGLVFLAGALVIMSRDFIWSMRHAK